MTLKVEGGRFQGRYEPPAIEGGENGESLFGPGFARLFGYAECIDGYLVLSGMLWTYRIFIGCHAMLRA